MVLPAPFVCDQVHGAKHFSLLTPAVGNVFQLELELKPSESALMSEAFHNHENLKCLSHDAGSYEMSNIIERSFFHIAS